MWQCERRRLEEEWLLARFRYCFFTINENEKQFGIMAAPFFAVEHTVHRRMTRCESLLAQTITTNNSIATTVTTHTENAKFAKRSPPTFVSRGSAVNGVFSFGFFSWKIVSRAVFCPTVFLNSSRWDHQHNRSLLVILDWWHLRFKNEFQYHYPFWCYRGEETPDRVPVAEFKSTPFPYYIVAVSRNVFTFTYSN